MSDCSAKELETVLMAELMRMSQRGAFATIVPARPVTYSRCSTRQYRSIHPPVIQLEEVSDCVIPNKEEKGIFTTKLPDLLPSRLR